MIAVSSSFTATENNAAAAEGLQVTNLIEDEEEEGVQEAIEEVVVNKGTKRRRIPLRPTQPDRIHQVFNRRLLFSPSFNSALFTRASPRSFSESVFTHGGDRVASNDFSTEVLCPKRSSFRALRMCGPGSLGERDSAFSASVRRFWRGPGIGPCGEWTTLGSGAATRG
ncbi:hypothetical protein EV1_000477 [Malus domestica]